MNSVRYTVSGFPLTNRQSENTAEDALSEPVHPEVRIGHVHLQVADLKRATDLYHDVLGFDSARPGRRTGRVTNTRNLP